MLEHRFAKLTAAATFLLLLVGSTVNPTGSSLACPEAWFICHGEMFPEMQGGVLFEHGHRLVAMSVGLLQIGLTVLLWRRRPALRGLAVLGLFMVCIQGSLGAMTVKYQLPTAVSTSHLMLAMLYFATLIYAAWRTRPQARSDHGAASARLRPLLGVTALAILGQILIGALVRHTGGALACIDLPLCHGSLWPADAAAPLRLHMLHRIVGVLVGLVVLGASFVVYRRSPRGSALRMLALASPLLVAVQVTLGVLAITTFRGVPVVAAHLGGAALLWGLWVGAWFASAGRPAAEPRRHGRGRGAALDAGPIAGTEAA